MSCVFYQYTTGTHSTLAILSIFSLLVLVPSIEPLLISWVFYTLLPVKNWFFCLTFSLSYLSLWQVLDLNPCSPAKCSIFMLPGPSYILALIFTIFLILVSLAPNPCSWLNCSTIMQPGPSYLFALRFHYFPNFGASGWIWTLATRSPGLFALLFHIFFLSVLVAGFALVVPLCYHGTANFLPYFFTIFSNQVPVAGLKPLLMLKPLPGPSYLSVLPLHYFLPSGPSCRLWTLAHELSVLRLHHWNKWYHLPCFFTVFSLLVTVAGFEPLPMSRRFY